MGSPEGFVRYGFVEFPDSRGLIRARWMYSLKAGYFWPLKRFAKHQYLIDCEIKDLLDEVARRVRRRKYARDRS
ncbi:MAG: hypothetical protein EKK41_14910 [Hyphomicrobiales bacterium]|nr:MAG: hypothetical protein EKK41_14910 [Hyphomicrobiales bacterium]